MSDAHLRVDRLYSRFDLTAPLGLAAFCRANENALRTIRFPAPSAARAAEDRAAPSQSASLDGAPHPIDTAPMIAALQADRQTLGDDTPLPPLDGLAMSPHRVAVAYILLGSRLGTQVLRRDWAQSDDLRVQGAGRYFALPPLTAEWRRLVADLDTQPTASAEAQQILTDAEAIFDLFARAAQLELARLGLDAPDDEPGDVTDAEADPQT
ncbi:MAG: hypothetical protein ABNH26_05230 [Celeribacter sp.]